MIGGEPEYTIRGGRSDARRLGREARVMAVTSERFLSDAGLREGWACLDVGCGDGDMTVAMARGAILVRCLIAMCSEASSNHVGPTP